MNGTIKRNNLHELKSNITYGEIQKFSFPQLSNWVDELRDEIVDRWDKGNPPIIGKSKEGIIKSFRKLKDYPVENLLLLVDYLFLWRKYGGRTENRGLL